MACESWTGSLNASDWRLAIGDFTHLRSSQSSWSCQSCPAPRSWTWHLYARRRGRLSGIVRSFKNDQYSTLSFLGCSVVPSKTSEITKDFLVDVSDIFYFFCSGEPGETEREGGRFFLLKISGGGGSPRRGWEGARGPGGCLQGIWGNWGGGGAKYFFRGRNARQDFLSLPNASKPWKNKRKHPF